MPQRTIKFCVDRSAAPNGYTVDFEEELLVTYEVTPAELMTREYPGSPEELNLVSAVSTDTIMPNISGIPNSDQLHQLNDREAEQIIAACREDWTEYRANEADTADAMLEDARDFAREAPAFDSDFGV